MHTCASVLADWRATSSESALSPDETARAQAIGSAARREQFLAGRWLARTLLAQAQGGRPTDWNISADGYRKPSVMGHDLQLSIAHSGAFVACCVASRAVGVDVERMDRVRPVPDMAELVCSETEQSALRELHGAALTQQFLQLWTCKEARLKQRGMPFSTESLRAIQTEPAAGGQAHVATWVFALHNVVLSVAVDDLSQLHAQWPADWVADSVHWHRYI